MDIYDKIQAICATAISQHSATSPVLFDLITDQLLAAGISIDRVATTQARAQSPNVVAVLGEETSGYQEYIELEGDDFAVYPLEDDGRVLVELVTEKEARFYCEDITLTSEDLSSLRCIERDGVRLYSDDDIIRVSARKHEQLRAKREGQRILTLNLPDEFLQLCEEVGTTPATILEGFIADLCDLRERPYITNGSDERDLAEEYFDRCGYRFRAEGV